MYSCVQLQTDQLETGGSFHHDAFPLELDDMAGAADFLAAAKIFEGKNITFVVVHMEW